MNSAGHEFGRGRLADVVRAECDQSARHIVSAIFDEVDRFAKEAFDDQTVMVLKAN
jgi:serine phosphatase RsbU (regulator of sigma subunit)